MQREVIHAAYAQSNHAWECRASSIHEQAARITEVVSHSIILSVGFNTNSARLAKGLQVVAATQVSQVRIVDDEVGCV